MRKIAIIDLGSNSAKLIIWEIMEGGAYRIVEKSRDTCRLSEGMGKSNMLTPQAMMRTIRVLKIFAGLISSYGEVEVFAAASAAVRRAKNGAEFLRMVRIETGITIEVISGQEEAAYDYYGIINTLPINDCLLIDTGGGSVETVLIKGRKLISAAVLPIGSIALREQIEGGRGGMAPDKFYKATHNHAYEKLKEVSWLKEARGLPIVAVGGSNRALAHMHMRQTKYPLSRLHGYSMTPDQARELIENISLTPESKRMAIAGMEESRIDTIASGIAPLGAAIKAIKPERIIISECSVREGMFFKLLMSGQSPPVLPDVLMSSLENTALRYGQEIKHTRHVARLCALLYDKTMELHGDEGGMRHSLIAAAMLHDIGQAVEYENHEKHGVYLTLNSPIYGLTHRELVITAMLVGMHRINDANEDWSTYSALISKQDEEGAKRLGVILKLAEKLDRNNHGIIEDIEIFASKNEVQLLLKSPNDTKLQASAAMRQEKAFECIFGRKLVVI
ncbi:MAG: HD domain-containing protein [Christensenellales bacterium]